MNLTLDQFQITYKNGNHLFTYSNDIPKKAKEYLENYCKNINKYKNMTPNKDFATFSLYQPPLATPSGKRSLFMRLQRKFNHIKAPATVTFGMTKKCQCRCEHCSADYHMNTKDAELPLQTMIKGLNESVELGVTNIILVGGEPMLHSGVYDLIKSIDKEKASVVMFTNGEYLTEQSCKKLKEAGLLGVFISIDENDPEKHNKARKREGLFQNLKAGIKFAKDADLIVTISTYLTHEKLEENHYETMMEFGKKMQVDEITFFDAIPVGRYSAGSEVSTFLFEDDRKKITELTNRYRNLPDYPATSPQSILTSETGSSFCFAANTQFYLSSTGQVTPCDFTPLTIGKYPESTISELWNELVNSPLYNKRSNVCRMQDSEFREKTINRIPENAELPYPIQKLV